MKYDTEFVPLRPKPSKMRSHKTIASYKKYKIEAAKAHISRARPTKCMELLETSNLTEWREERMKVAHPIFMLCRINTICSCEQYWSMTIFGARDARNAQYGKWESPPHNTGFRWNRSILPKFQNLEPSLVFLIASNVTDVGTSSIPCVAGW